MKATAQAPANIAFIKYWGRVDEKLRLPTNGSISMNLSNLTSTTTVEFSDEFKSDDVVIDGNKNEKEVERVIEHLDRIRKLAGIDLKAKVVSINNFPVSTGLSSSASGFAALTVASAKALGLNLDEKELSILARLASGSACRSIPSGFVEWLEGNSSETSYAVSIFPSSWWDITDVVAVISTGKKEISTTDGQKVAYSSPFFPQRLEKIGGKIKMIKDYIKQRNFGKFGQLIESEALEMHAIMITSNPPLLYWQPETIRMMKLVKCWRNDNLPVYFTLNTGQDIHLLCEKKNVDKILEKLKSEKIVKKVFINNACNGAKLISDHLF